MNDLDIDLDDFTETEAEIFKIDALPTISYESDYVVQMDIRVEMSRDQELILRTTYTILDVLADVGGIQSIFQSTVILFLGIWNYSHF